MYRKRPRFSKKQQEAMQAGRERARMATPLEERPPSFDGKLCRQIIIRDLYFETVEHTLDCYGTRRRDVYRIVADGKEWPKRMGWSRALEMARKAFVRMGSHGI